MKKHNQELEIEEDFDFEQKTWTIQRISWVVMLLILVAALLGFTGRGGLAGINKLKAETTAMQIEYDRFLRDQVSNEVKISLHSSNPTLHFSKEFQEKVRVEQIIPQPESVESSADGISYTFRTRTPDSQIIFYIKPNYIGSLQTTISGPANQAVTLSQFIYP